MGEPNLVIKGFKVDAEKSYPKGMKRENSGFNERESRGNMDPWNSGFQGGYCREPFNNMGYMNGSGTFPVGAIGRMGYGFAPSSGMNTFNPNPGLSNFSVKAEPNDYNPNSGLGDAWRNVNTGAKAVWQCPEMTGLNYQQPLTWTRTSNIDYQPTDQDNIGPIRSSGIGGNRSAPYSVQRNAGNSAGGYRTGGGVGGAGRW